MTAPAPQVQYAGVGVVGADQYNTYVQVCSNYAQMRTFNGLAGMVVCALGTTASNDGGQGHFYWSLGTYTDNNSTIIVPYSQTGGAWLRLTGI